MNETILAVGASGKFAGEDLPSERGVANCAGGEDFIANSRGIAPQGGPTGVGDQRDRNRERIAAGDIATDDIDARRTCGSAQTRIETIEEA